MAVVCASVFVCLPGCIIEERTWGYSKGISV